MLSKNEKVLALKNALRYFPVKQHEELAHEFASELKEFGRIYMYRFKPDYKIYARPISEYPAETQAKSIMLMIQNNLRSSYCSASRRIDYLWREWICISKLGTILAMYAILSRNE